MRRCNACARLLFLTLLLFAPTAFLQAADLYWPQGSDWQSISPDDAGVYSKKLRSAVDYALKANSYSIVVVRRGRIVAEAYGTGNSRDEPHEMFSAAKSVISVLAGMALSDRKFKSLDQSASDFVPSWKGSEKEKITIRHLLSMTSGLSQKGLQIRNVQGDQFALNAATKLEHAPGTHWEYNTAAYHLMFHVIAKASGESFDNYAQRRLVGPLRMENWAWVSNQTKGLNKVTNYYSAECTARDMARIGLLMLRNGQWNNRQLVSARYVRQSTSPSQDLNPSYGMLWWTNAKPGRTIGTPILSGGPPGPTNGLRFPNAPTDGFAALGHLNQDILVVPSLDLVVVRQGDAPREANFTANLLKRVLDSLKPEVSEETAAAAR